jgi:hypothetical protein
LIRRAEKKEKRERHASSRPRRSWWLCLSRPQSGQRWHAHYHTAGTGHLYQGRYKAFLAHRRGGEGDVVRPLLHRWPVPEPADWLTRVNRVETQAELEALRRSGG